MAVERSRVGSARDRQRTQVVENSHLDRRVKLGSTSPEAVTERCSPRRRGGVSGACGASACPPPPQLAVSTSTSLAQSALRWIKQVACRTVLSSRLAPGRHLRRLHVPSPSSRFAVDKSRYSSVCAGRASAPCLALKVLHNRTATSEGHHRAGSGVCTVPMPPPIAPSPRTGNNTRTPTAPSPVFSSF